MKYLNENGKLVTESLRENALKRPFASLDDFMKPWKTAERKRAISKELEAESPPLDPLGEELGRNVDPFDVKDRPHPWRGSSKSGHRKGPHL